MKPGLIGRYERPAWQIRASCLNAHVYERFLEKWFGVDPIRERDDRPPNDPLVVAGGQVRAARVHASLTQRQVEDLTGIDQTSISRLENGRGSNMRLGRFALLLAAIDAEIRPAERPVPAWIAPLLVADR
jgi:DNA-binding XRE family transcriptional regulator